MPNLLIGTGRTLLDRRAVVAGPSPLLTDLVAYWKLDEASGTRFDSVGVSHLADNNTVTQTTGKIGSGAEFVAANSEYLRVADNDALSMGDIDFTVGAWVKFATLGAFIPIVSKGTGFVAATEYALYLNAARLNFLVSNGAASGAATDTTAISTGTWYFVIAWHDATANTVNIQANNGTPVSASYASGSWDSTQPFDIGVFSGIPIYLNGVADEAFVYKRVLTADERTQLYNSGAGLTYPFT